MDSLKPNDVVDLQNKGRLARELISSTPFPEDLTAQISHAFEDLKKECGPLATFAVRSSGLLVA
jgi:pyruvate,water dikinase